ncbi:hypothetical protein HOLleu_32621 [Holothuria leucospilota]|uniref:Uncharacterized protein n=1 Tax=Holothuria leucospilota TaxID=206669 RepID=A0A9Q1BJ36_HOLLE|nr:hypothetical protein HOLleu_32621 [Holothuria leucospilota]
MIAIVFGGGQRSFGVTRGKKVKKLVNMISQELRVTVRDHILTLCIDHIEKMISIIFRAGQRSFEVTKGQNLVNIIF